MGKVRYKEPSGNFQKMSGAFDTLLRASIGRESGVGEYYYLSTDILIPYKKQARKVFNDEEIKNLSETISEYGVKNPLLVIRSHDEEGKFEVVSGERRLRAAKLVGFEKVPCIIIDDEKAEEIALIENIQRSDLHPVELGDALQSLYEKANWGELTELTKKIGKDKSSVSNCLSYAKLPRYVKIYLIDNGIKERDIFRRLLKMESEDEMMSFLMNDSKRKSSSTKNILRIQLKEGKFLIQYSAIYKLSVDEKELLKVSLTQLLEKIGY